MSSLANITSPSRTSAGKKAKASPSVQFVNISHPDEIRDRRNQHVIKRHAMKDIGFSRRKGNALQARKPELSEATVSDAGVMVLSPGQDLPLYSATDMRAKRMKGFLLREHSPMCYKVRQVCFAIGLLEGGAMHLAFAETALYHQNKLEPRLATQIECRLLYREDPLALRYYNTSLGLLYQQIQKSPGNNNTGIFGTMLGLANYDLVVGNLDRWSMHMAGLERMVREQGGPQTLTSDNLLKSLLWVDIAGCMLLGRQPRFNLGVDAFAPFTAPVLTPLLRSITENLEKRLARGRELSAILASLSAVPVLYGTEDPKEEGSGTLFCFNVARSAFLVLNLPPASTDGPEGADAPLEKAMHEAIRLAVHIWLVRVLGFLPESSNFLRIRAARLSYLLKRYDARWSGLEELELWVLMVAILGGEKFDKRALIARVSLLMESLELDEFAVNHVLDKIAWIDDAFTEKASSIGSMQNELRLNVRLRLGSD